MDLGRGERAFSDEVVLTAQLDNGSVIWREKM